LPRGALRKELIASLRKAHQRRRPRTRGTDRRGSLPNMASIHGRPIEVAARQVPGHWEGDLIKGAGNRSAVGTLVERAATCCSPGCGMPLRTPPSKPSPNASAMSHRVSAKP